MMITGPRRWMLALSVGAILAVPAARADERPDRPTFALHLVNGTDHTGRLEAIGPPGTFAVRETKTFEAPVDDVLWLRRPGVPVPAPPLGRQLVFANGDRLAIRGARMAGEVLHARTGALAGGEIPVPLSAVGLVWFALPHASEREEPVLRRLAGTGRKRDRLLLRNGDALEGMVTALDTDREVTVRTTDRDVPVAAAAAAALALSSDLASAPPLPGAHARMVVQDGSRITVASCRLDGPVVKAQTSWGREVAVPLEKLVSLEVVGGRGVSLSDLPSRRYEFTPYLPGDLWPFARDTTLRGNPLRLAGDVYDKGIAMHAASRLEFDLGRQYRTFEAVVGLDDDAGKEGTARVNVLVDGRNSLPEEGPDLSAATGARRLRLDVTGAGTLTLTVDFGRRGGVQAHVDWCDARLIR